MTGICGQKTLRRQHLMMNIFRVALENISRTNTHHYWKFSKPVEFETVACDSRCAVPRSGKKLARKESCALPRFAFSFRGDTKAA